METQPKQVLVTQQGRVVTLTLNRPERMNAWTYEMHAELTAAIEAGNADDAVGAMIITGAGRGFCAGADVGDVFAKQNSDPQAAAANQSKNRRNTGSWVDLLRQSKPIIAAVNGACVGVGATMILPCDIIMASHSAKIGVVFVKMGVVPELASSHFLVQRMGFGRASEMCLSGRIYPAAEAHEQGLIDHLLAPDELLPQAQALAAQLAQNPSTQMRWIKQLLTQNGSETDLAAVQKRELALLDKAFQSAEHKEAISAFMEKREPDFVQAAKRAAKASL